MNRERFNAFLAAVRAMRDAATDEQAKQIPGFFKEWKSGETYTAGERVQMNGTLYTVLQNHTSQADWTPTAAPSLFAEVLPGQGGTEIGEWVQPDSTNPYMTGDRVTFEGKTYESVIDNNIWSPSAYPAGWREVTE